MSHPRSYESFSLFSFLAVVSHRFSFLDSSFLFLSRISENSFGYNSDTIRIKQSWSHHFGIRKTTRINNSDNRTDPVFGYKYRKIAKYPKSCIRFRNFVFRIRFLYPNRALMQNPRINHFSALNISVGPNILKMSSISKFCH